MNSFRQKSAKKKIHTTKTDCPEQTQEYKIKYTQIKHVHLRRSWLNNGFSRKESSSYPFGLYSSGHKMVQMHRSHPLTDGSTGFGHLGD